jgi:predicted nucleic acid-binding protein
MGDQVKSQIEAWRIFDRWFDDERIAFLHEPPQTEPIFRKLTQRHQANTNVWPDAYLAAVAKSAGLLVVTLDQGFGHMAGADAVVLQG